MKALRLLIALMLSCACAEAAQEKAHVKKPKRIKVNPADEEFLGVNFTEEFNFYWGTVYSNTLIDYAARSGWAVGLQLLNVPVYGGGAQNYEYDGYFTISKTFKFSQYWSLALGSQFGTALANVTPNQLHDFTFIDNQFDVNENFNFHLGPFYVNDALAMIHQPYGVMVGFEIRLLPKCLHVQGDYFSGNSNISGSIVNLIYFPMRNLQAYIGINVPARDSGNEFAGNVGFIYSLK